MDEPCQARAWRSSLAVYETATKLLQSLLIPRLLAFVTAHADDKTIAIAMEEGKQVAPSTLAIQAVC